MKIAFVCDLPIEHFPFWDDGLKAALDVLKEKYNWEISIYNLAGGLDLNSLETRKGIGVIWSSLTSEISRYRLFEKQVLLFGGGVTYTPAIHNFDLVVAESKVDFLDFKRFGINTIQAFGTNTNLFKPMLDQPKIFSYVYPAAFAKWKNHDRFAEFMSHGDRKKGFPALALGYMQPGGWEKECYEVCQKNGIAVLPWVPYSVMPYIINASENVYVAADVMGGCQRTVLEAKACGVPVAINSDSPKLLELQNLTREDILNEWSEESYAKKLKKGIESIL